MDFTLVVSAYVSKKIRRSDTPSPPFLGAKEWSLLQIFDFFKRNKIFLEDELKKFFLPKDAYWVTQGSAKRLGDVGTPLVSLCDKALYPAKSRFSF